MLGARAAMLRSAAAPVLRSCRAARVAAPLPRRDTEPLPAAPEPVLWPFAAGVAGVGGILLGSLWCSRDSTVESAVSWISTLSGAYAKGQTSEEMAPGDLLRVGVAFVVSSLPAESLAARVVEAGGLRAWGELLNTYDVEQQSLAIGAACTLLQSESALEAFQRDANLFDALLQVLPPLLHEGSGPRARLETGEVLLDALTLGCAMSTHPMFEHAGNDGWLWERLLESTAPAVQLDGSAALHWACLAAAAAGKHDSGLALLENDAVLAGASLSNAPTLPPS